MRTMLMWMSVEVVSCVRIVQCHAIIDVVIDVRVMECHASMDVVIGVRVVLCHQAIDNLGFSTFLNFPLRVQILRKLFFSYSWIARDVFQSLAVPVACDFRGVIVACACDSFVARGVPQANSDGGDGRSWSSFSVG